MTARNQALRVLEEATRKKNASNMGWKLERLTPVEVVEALAPLLDELQQCRDAGSTLNTKS